MNSVSPIHGGCQLIMPCCVKGNFQIKDGLEQPLVRCTQRTQVDITGDLLQGCLYMYIQHTAIHEAEGNKARGAGDWNGTNLLSL